MLRFVVAKNQTLFMQMHTCKAHRQLNVNICDFGSNNNAIRDIHTTPRRRKSIFVLYAIMGGDWTQNCSFCLISIYLTVIVGLSTSVYRYPIDRYMLRKTSHWTRTPFFCVRFSLGRPKAAAETHYIQLPIVFCTRHKPIPALFCVNIGEWGDRIVGFRRERRSKCVSVTHLVANAQHKIIYCICLCTNIDREGRIEAKKNNTFD